MTKRVAEQALVEAVLRAVEKRGVPNSFGLAELEIGFGGPAAGAAGSVVRRWPAPELGGLVARGLRLRMGKEGRRTVVQVEEVKVEDGEGNEEG